MAESPLDPPEFSASAEVIPASPANDGNGNGNGGGGGGATPPPLPANNVPAKPRVWTAFLAFGLTLAAMIMWAIILAVAAIAFMAAIESLTGATPEDPGRLMIRLGENRWYIVATSILGAFSMLGIAVVGGWLSREQFRTRLALRQPRPASIWLWLLAMLGMFAVSSGLDDLKQLFGLQSDALDFFAQLASSSGNWFFLLLVWWIGILAPLAEELLFRGYIQTRLTRRWGPLVGVGVSSLLFGIMHLDPIHSLLAVGLGLYLGYLAWRFDSLWPALVAHTINNLWACLAVRIFYDPEQSFSTLHLLADLAVCTTITVLAITMLAKRLPKEPATNAPIPRY